MTSNQRDPADDPAHPRHADASEPVPGDGPAGHRDRTRDGLGVSAAASTEADADAEGRSEPTRRSRRRGSGRRRTHKNGFVQWLKELPILLAVAFIVAVLLKSFVVQAFWIPSGSMEQTLHGCPGCTGDRILVNRMSYWFSDPEPGDIVVFQAGPSWDPEVRVDEPSNPFGAAWLWLKRMVGAAPPGEKDLVKRVIATGGQTVECCDAQQRVLVDGRPLNEPYIFNDGQPPGAIVQQMPFGPVQVPDGRLFVMGDHRGASADSRFHLDDQYQGTIAVDSVIGRAFVIIYPFDRFAWLSPVDIQASAAPLAIAAYPPLLPMVLVAPLAMIRLGERRRYDE